MEYEKWELNPEDRNINISDKKLVLKKMLPNDTRIVNDIKKYLIYYATQLNKENIRLKDVLEKNNNNTVNNNEIIIPPGWVWVYPESGDIHTLVPYTSEGSIIVEKANGDLS